MQSGKSDKGQILKGKFRALIVNGDKAPTCEAFEENALTSVQSRPNEWVGIWDRHDSFHVIRFETVQFQNELALRKGR